MPFYIDALSKLPDGKTTARHVADYYTYGEATTAAKHMIDSFLFREFRDSAAKGISADELLERFKARGERPVILRRSKGDSSTNVSRFDADAYAKLRCKEICGGAPQG
jgi:hypothetical protein